MPARSRCSTAPRRYSTRRSRSASGRFGFAAKNAGNDPREQRLDLLRSAARKTSPARRDDSSALARYGPPPSATWPAAGAAWFCPSRRNVPSTTNSFPGYSCGVVRLFSMRGSACRRRAHFDAQRFADQPFEFCRMARRGPQFQFSVARRAQLQTVRHRPDRVPRDPTRVASDCGRGFRPAGASRPGADRTAALSLEVAVVLVARLGGAWRW